MEDEYGKEQALPLMGSMPVVLLNLKKKIIKKTSNAGILILFFKILPMNIMLITIRVFVVHKRVSDTKTIFTPFGL